MCNIIIETDGANELRYSWFKRALASRRELHDVFDLCPPGPNANEPGEHAASYSLTRCAPAQKQLSPVFVTDIYAHTRTHNLSVFPSHTQRQAGRQ